MSPIRMTLGRTLETLADQILFAAIPFVTVFMAAALIRAG